MLSKLKHLKNVLKLWRYTLLEKTLLQFALTTNC